ncbi:Tim17/Tim22/Tim23/Pmp24 family-domain-containing protein [Lipomyces chichibuensis]|uniref:Tim17/Tim22/Tim23/Pmp24 family-domain-containing protein n=1 Tax=Lipomyces chichibuensis TaxID=1546026 RepID=UPI003343EFA3
MDRAIDTLQQVILDPKYHDILGILKGLRNGAIYGSKVRFAHALVMTFLFRNGSFKDKMVLIIKATREHARNLATFVFIYKSTLYVLKSTNGKEQDIDTFIAGLLGGYVVFGRGGKSSVNQQIVLYVFSRVVLGLAKLTVKKKLIPSLHEDVGNKVWPAFAAVCWGLVMYMFRTDPDVLQPSMKTSMDYIYLDSNRWDSLRNLVWHNE